MSKLDDILYKEADIINSAQIKQQIKDLMLELIASEALGARFPSTMEHEKLRQVLRQKIEEL